MPVPSSTLLTYFSIYSQCGIVSTPLPPDHKTDGPSGTLSRLQAILHYRRTGPSRLISG